VSLYHKFTKQSSGAYVKSAILILATIIIDEVFSQDKNQKVTPKFMQGVA
jgi:hypothetical protein